MGHAKYHMVSRIFNAAEDDPNLDQNAELVLNHVLTEIFSLRGPEGIDRAMLKENLLSLADAIRRVDKAKEIAPEHILEAYQYLCDLSQLYSSLIEERTTPMSHSKGRGQLVSGPGSPIYKRIETVFREWGHPVPEPTNEALQALAESVGFKFDGPAIGPAP